MSATFHTVTIVGATGVTGYPIAEAFLNDGSYKVKVLRKKPENASRGADDLADALKGTDVLASAVGRNDKANLLASRGAEVIFVDYDQENELADALKGTDVLVSAVGRCEDMCVAQCKLLAAAKKSGVKRFIPSEYGIEHSPGTAIVTGTKNRFQKELEKSGLEYTFIYTGLSHEYLTRVYDVKNKRAEFYVDGNTKLASTSLGDIGKYVAESLKVPEARNAHIRVAGTILTLNEYLQKFEEASGSKWEVIHEKARKNDFDKFIATILENGSFESVDNDKFSFTPRPVTETINILAK